MSTSSISPQNVSFPIPDELASQREGAEIREICSHQKSLGKDIVVVQGLGFVGAVMAAIVADCEAGGRAPYFVVGVNSPSPRSYWKIPVMNSGLSPFKAQDPEVDKIFHRVARVKSNLRATWVPDAYAEADIIIVDINLDVTKLEKGNAQNARVEIGAFKRGIGQVSQNMRPDALILIETTVPPGTVEHIVKPIVEKAFNERGIDLQSFPPQIAYSYERVMPGDHYIESVKKMWRTFSATNDEAYEKASSFLSSIIDTKSYPLCRLQSTTAAEMAKIMENSYRAMNIAFIHEWTLFAEDIGINLFQVVNSIRVRKGTHDNMMFPGFGVGGYCLTKDPILAQWASQNIFGRPDRLQFSVEAVNVNDMMPHHTFELLKKSMGDMKAKKVAILGASYRKDVDDTRNTPTVILYDDIKEAGGEPAVHDPFVSRIIGREEIDVSHDVDATLKDADAVAFVVNHQFYKDMPAESVTSRAREGASVVDAFDVLSDDTIVTMKKHGLKVSGVGKGHIRYL